MVGLVIFACFILIPALSKGSRVLRLFTNHAWPTCKSLPKLAYKPSRMYLASYKNSQSLLAIGQTFPASSWSLHRSAFYYVSATLLNGSAVNSNESLLCNDTLYMLKE